MKGLHRKLRNKQGFVSYNHEPMTMITIIAILSAIIIPSISKSPASRDAACVKNLIAIAHGSSDHAEKCPVSGMPYRPVVEGGTVTLSCPDPKTHLMTSPVVMVGDNELIFEQEFPQFNGEMGETLQLSKRTELSVLEDAFVITERMGIWGYIVTGLIVLVMTGALLTGIVLLVETKDPKGGLSIVCSAAIVCLIGGLIFRPTFNTQRYTFSKTDKSVSIQQLYAGETFTKPSIIDDAIAIVPLRTRKAHARIAVFFGTPNDIQYKKMFWMDREELGVASLLSHALFDDGSSIVKAKQSHEVDETTARSEDRIEKHPNVLVRLKRIFSSKRDTATLSSQWLQQHLSSTKKPDVPEFKMDVPKSNEQQWTNPALPPDNYDTEQTPYSRYQAEQDMLRDAAREEMRRQRPSQREIWRQQLHLQELARQQAYQQEIARQQARVFQQEMRMQQFYNK